ncbi:hypothetical protein F8O01_06950 [Pseudoclavibacter chungangensis]|uniref:Uncharacterized protein n=1 Tax=Pseudoclavibacter chungangensis TaxID=587635 RepID=A0A7J5BUG2_9MICO|nr:hypothetical protein [Pseudoclavibacter chungangensis]KAB1657997.1 hypothetical protein F8O01_06950 [Pseudoclavibacter chungangensis]NYJ65841.1 hypothetical protein [Pseudoclavibacter chungangensis]
MNLLRTGSPFGHADAGFVAGPDERGGADVSGNVESISAWRVTVRQGEPFIVEIEAGGRDRSHIRSLVRGAPSGGGADRRPVVALRTATTSS